jgi:hypothetical protein
LEASERRVRGFTGRSSGGDETSYVETEGSGGQKFGWGKIDVSIE